MSHSLETVQVKKGEGMTSFVQFYTMCGLSNGELQDIRGIVIHGIRHPSGEGIEATTK